MSQGDISTKQKVYPWLLPVAWAFISAASIEMILIGGSNYFVSVGTDLGSPVSQVALMMTCCTITLSICAPIAGRLFTKIDSRIVLTVMGLIVVLGYASLSFGQNVWQWWLVGIIYGIGGSGIFIIGGPIFIGNWFKKRVGFATGLYGMLLALLSLILQPCVGAAITTFGWRSAYLIMAVVAAVLIFPWTLFVVRYRPEDVGLKPYGYEEGVIEEKVEEKTGPGVPYRRAIVSIAFVALVISAGLECNLGGFKSNWSNIAQSDAWGYVLANGQDWAIMFGATMLSFTTAAKFTMPIFGWIADKWGSVKTNLICLALIIIGFAFMLMFPSVPALVLVGCFFVGFDSVLMKQVIPLTVREIFGDKDYSKVYSLLYGIINFLGAFATSLIALVGEVTGGWDGVFILGIGLTAGSFIFLVVAKAAGKKLVWED